MLELPSKQHQIERKDIQKFFRSKPKNTNEREGEK